MSSGSTAVQLRLPLTGPAADGSRGRTPSVWLVHLALILPQCIFAGGSVVGKLGVSKFNPMMFALIRECAAGVCLLAIALVREGWQPPRKADVHIFVACGFFIFTNQAAFILGDKLAGAILASAWQPTQPVFTLMISLLLGWETFTPGKAAGIAISFGGAAFMVCYGADFSSGSAGHKIVGNMLLAANCLGTSLYVIVGKVALAREYSPITVTAWSYLFGALMMLAVASGFSSSCDMVHFVCPEDSKSEAFACGSYVTSCDAWAVPTDAILPLIYWVLFNSIAAYLLMTWGNLHARAGFVLAYCALQPLGAMALSALIISLVGNGSDLTEPGLNALGSIPILTGLAVILWEGRRQHDRDSKALLLSESSEACRSCEPLPDGISSEQVQGGSS